MAGCCEHDARFGVVSGNDGRHLWIVTGAREERLVMTDHDQAEASWKVS